MVALLAVDDIQIVGVHKKHNKSDLAKAKNIIQRFGQFKSILVNKTARGYELVAGSLVLAACKELKLDMVYCWIFVDMGHDQTQAVHLIENTPKVVDVVHTAKVIESIGDPQAIDRLSNLMPFSRKELRNFAALKNFNWGDFDNNPKHFQASLFDL